MSTGGKWVAREKVGPRPGHVRSGAGVNARFVDAEALDLLLLPRDAFGFDAENYAGAEILDDSMEPLLPEGCLVLIDTSDKTPRRDGIFVLRTAEGRCAVKHVEILDARRIALIPANRAAFHAEICELAAGESLVDRIFGRVVWRALRLKNGAGEQPPGR